MVSGCPSEEQIFDLLSRGRLGPDAQVHVDSCQRCRKLIARVAEALVEERAEDPAELFATARIAPNDATWRRLHAGSTIAHEFVLEEFLGGGGMGVVWGARRLDSGERVALKFLRALDNESVARQQREALAATRLVHPNVLRLQGVHPGESGLGPLLVCERLYGETLAVPLAREGTLSVAGFSRIFAAILAGVMHAHQQGVVHRDLKPENIYLAQSGTAIVPKVLDFGIARVNLEQSSLAALTKSGALLGSPRYMAPEQIFGEPCSAASDAWSLGIIAYRALLGSFPIAGDTIGEIVAALTRGRVERARGAPSLPAPVSDWIDRTLSVKSVERPALTEGLALFSRLAA